VERHQRVNSSTIVGELRTHLDDPAVDDRTRSQHKLAQLHRYKHRRMCLARYADEHRQRERAHTESHESESNVIFSGQFSVFAEMHTTDVAKDTEDSIQDDFLSVTSVSSVVILEPVS